MDFMELAKKRFSVRKYKDTKVDRDKIKEVLEAGRIAPSAVNFQPWHFIVIDDEELKEKICTTYGRNWIKFAPVIIVVCGDHNVSWHRDDGKDHCDIDIAIAIDHMTLKATEMGLGTCWVCKFDAEKCHDILNLPDNIEAIALLPLGYPLKEADTERHQKMRKSAEEITHWNTW